MQLVGQLLDVANIFAVQSEQLLDFLAMLQKNDAHLFDRLAQVKNKLLWLQFYFLLSIKLS